MDGLNKCLSEGPCGLPLQRQGVVCSSSCKYNEIVFDGAKWKKAMPHTVEAIFFTDRGLRDDEMEVRGVHLPSLKAWAAGVAGAAAQAAQRPAGLGGAVEAVLWRDHKRRPGLRACRYRRRAVAAPPASGGRAAASGGRAAAAAATAGLVGVL